MTDIKELVKRLREHATDWNGQQMPDLEPAKGDPTAGTLRSAALALEALAGEVERLEAQIAADDINAQRVTDLLVTTIKGRDRLKAALRLWQDAWATGRNEPMAIAANATKNELGDAA